ncbi:TonB-dependent receptor [Altererythrobacter indicus]|uniref:TonB-dependent receptor n=1 Tax=Altericroceibacterium indicum TaxID=374177 RepID=A0A845A8I2_9SPHN|nr:TonB-dependent receptor [Altericroceibacterium indicum]MXP26682.1 TonB-dependent receptor [Altericroceibacterium indicum]
MPARCLACALLTLACWVGPLAVEPALAQSTIAIPEGSLSKALQFYAARTGHQILFDPALVQGKRVSAIQVSRQERTGLRQILRGTGLQARIIAGGVIIISRSKKTRRKTMPSPETPNQVQPPSDPTPQNIVVTAMKRPSLVLQTPGTINVVTRDQIATRNLTELRDLARVSPSLAVVDSRNGEQRIAIRGIYGTGEATVGVYFGETHVSGPSGTTLDPSGTTPDIELADIDRVELLSGPQGTLYGASSMGGTLRLLLHQPEMSEPSASITTGAVIAKGGDPGGNITGIINAPLVRDKLALRTVIYRRASSSYIDKPALGLTNVGRVERKGERAILTWSPSDLTKVTGTFFSHRLALNDSLSWEMGSRRYQNDAPVRTPYSSKLRLGNVTVESQLGNVDLLATGSHYQWDLLRQNNFTSVLAQQRDNPDGCARLFGLSKGAICDTQSMSDYAAFVDSRLPGMLYQPMGVRSTSGEVRLQSSNGNASQWSIGAFFENRSDSAESYTVRADKDTGRPVFPLDITGLRFIRTSLEQRALFGEYQLSLSDRLKFSAGMRHFFYKRTAFGNVAEPNVITGTGDIAEGVFSTHQNGTSLKFELTWDNDRNLFTYLRASQGFRPGGVNITPGLPPGEQVYHSDSLWSYEAGAKLRTSNGSDVEAAIYHVDWANMIYYTGSPNRAFFYNANVGSVDVNGFETRFHLVVAPLWSFQGRLSYTSARLTDSGATALGAQPGDRLPDVTPFSFSLGTVWKNQISNGIYGIFQLNANGITGSRSQFNSSFDYYEKLRGHVLFDASATFEHRHWNLGIGVQNIFNAIGATRISSTPSSSRQVYGGRPRSYYLQVTRNF